MSTILGFDAFTITAFQSNQPPITNLNYLDVSDCIIDEIYVRTDTDSSVDITSTKNPWYQDTVMDAKFEGTLEAGNISNEGVQITNIHIKRRTAGTTNNLLIDTLPFVSGQLVNYTDPTQPCGDLVYQVVPVAQNGFEGVPNEVSVESSFYGFFIVDKDTGQTFALDLVLSNDSHNMLTYGVVDTKLNQTRIEITTLSQYPQIYYTDTQYHSGSLTCAIAPSAEYSWQDWNTFVNLITQHKGLILKAGSGDIMVCDIYGPSKQSLLNAYKGSDYITITLNFTEIQDYETFLTGVSGTPS